MRAPLTSKVLDTSVRTLSWHLLPLVLAAGCGTATIDFKDTGPGTSDTDPSDTDPDTAVSGALSVSPTSLDFGVIFVGETGALEVSITNVGEGEIALSATVEGASTYTVTTPDSPAPGGTVSAVVTFAPTGFGTVEATLLIEDTLGDGSVTVTLIGEAQEDADGDGYGSAESGGEDCDDTNAAAFPGATEIWYDGVDEDCLGGDDYDRDSDGVDYTTDCDEEDPNTYPGAPEIWYDGIDQDCAGDDDFDQDADGFDVGTDCDDTNAETFPGATDTWYDGVDSNCDGASDYDQDADGYDLDADCDDTNASINPGATETWYDGVDSDCDGANDYDQDGDGVDYPTDCNDTDATVTGPVTETLDGLDTDCDGLIDDIDIADIADGAIYGGSASIAIGEAGSLSLGGDLTGDGGDDVVIVSDNSSSGYAWVLAGTTAATANGLVDSYDTATITGSSSYYPLTQVIGPMADVTGDGTEDLLITGASSSTSSYYTYGHGWLLRGGSLLTGSLSTSSTYTARFDGDSDADRLRQLASGDIDGDGDLDVITGCPADNYSSGYYSADYQTGNVAVFEAGTFSGTYDLGDSEDQIHGSNDYDYLGWSLVVADLDDDGYDDIVAGAYGLDDGASNAGGVYVFSGNASLSWSSRADDAMSARILGSSSSSYLGYNPLAAPGDIDGDGTLDLVLGSSYAGKAWLWWDAGTLTGSSSVTSADITFTGTASSFAVSTAYASDLDGDGADELYIGDSGNDTAASNAGAVYRFQPSGTGSLTSADATATFWGTSADDALGSGLAAGGDADGDGMEDLLIGASGDDDGASNGGAVFVVLGR